MQRTMQIIRIQINKKIGAIPKIDKVHHLHLVPREDVTLGKEQGGSTRKLRPICS